MKTQFNIFGFYKISSSSKAKSFIFIIKDNFAKEYEIMATNPEAQVISSFPLPPSNYIKNFTNENVLKNLAPKPPSYVNIENYTMFG